MNEATITSDNTKREESKFYTPKVPYLLSLYIIVVVLLFSGFAKIIDPLALIKTLDAIKPFWGSSVNILLITILPIFEIGLSLLLVFKIKLKFTLLLTLLLFITFLFYSIYGYYLGLTNDCGCFGDIIKSEFGMGMVVRNFMFVMIVTYLNFTTKMKKV